MKLSGEARLSSAVADVYAALHDPAILVRTIPGCQRLEQTGVDTYAATVLAGVASMKGIFDADVRLSDAEVPHSFTLRASGAGAPGTVHAVTRVTLTPIENGTLLCYDADATIGGVIGGVGQRMILSVARKTAAEFFAAVDRALAGDQAEARAGVVTAGPDASRSDGAGPAVRSGGVWTAPVPVVDPARQRARDLLVGATFGALVALLGVLVGAIVAGW